VNEYIKQFSIGEIKKADIKINDVIRTIQDLKFKTAVEGQRDKRKSKLTGIEQQELGRSRSPLASILGFFPWIILSLAPLASLAIDFLFKSLKRLYARILKPLKKKINPLEDDNSNSQFLFSIKNIIPSVFYNLCIAWDWINIRYKLFLKINLKQ